ncbi:hypothetical protein EDD21DRAFT_39155 [Dissophora ornata]|nr:hypothetical protein EDD21DRAFT_39155 [Dissophora ornata]
MTRLTLILPCGQYNHCSIVSYSMYIPPHHPHYHRRTLPLFLFFLFLFRLSFSLSFRFPSSLYFIFSFLLPPHPPPKSTPLPFWEGLLLYPFIHSHTQQGPSFFLSHPGTLSLSPYSPLFRRLFHTPRQHPPQPPHLPRSLSHHLFKYGQSWQCSTALNPPPPHTPTPLLSPLSLRKS